MSSTSSRRPSRPRESVQLITAGGRSLRVSVREGTDDATPPLLLLNGIGASLEVLQPFVDALHPRRTVIRFDVPGVGGSPRPVVPYTLITFSPVVRFNSCNAELPAAASSTTIAPVGFHSRASRSIWRHKPLKSHRPRAACST